MTAARYDITIDQGSDFLTFFIIKTTSTSGVTTIRNLTGFQARASLRPTIESSVVHNFSAGVTSPGTDGKIVMSLSSVRSRDIPAGIYRYDLEIFNTGTGSVERVLSGQVTLTREVTR